VDLSWRGRGAKEAGYSDRLGALPSPFRKFACNFLLQFLPLLLFFHLSRKISHSSINFRPTATAPQGWKNGKLGAEKPPGHAHSSAATAPEDPVAGGFPSGDAPHLTPHNFAVGGTFC